MKLPPFSRMGCFLLVGLPRMLLVAGRLRRDMRGPASCGLASPQTNVVYCTVFLFYGCFASEVEKRLNPRTRLMIREEIKNHLKSGTPPQTILFVSCRQQITFLEYSKTSKTWLVICHSGCYRRQTSRPKAAILTFFLPCSLTPTKTENSRLTAD